MFLGVRPPSTAEKGLGPHIGYNTPWGLEPVRESLGAEEKVRRTGLPYSLIWSAKRQFCRARGARPVRTAPSGAVAKLAFCQQFSV